MTIEYLVADLFCGAGGTSTGAERAVKGLGAEMVLVAVNHWPVSIETHQKNHPSARHYIEDLTVADPERLVPEGRLDLLLAAPECRFHSNARGGKPIHDQGRMDPWAVIRWLTALDVRCVLIENVPEFVRWGPAVDGRLDQKRRGLYFEAWVKSFWELGYTTDWRVLNAADFGDATTRRRFFLQARKDGRSIHWPEPTHTQSPDPLFATREKWRAAREVIDWANSGRSLLDDARYQARPLSDKTRRRIARGLERFGGPLAPLFIQLLSLDAGHPGGKDGDHAKPDGASPSPAAFVMGKQSSPAIRGANEPLPTVTTDGAPTLVQPVAELVGANRNNNVPRDAAEPMPPATTAPGGGLYLVEVMAEPFVLGQQSGSAPRETDEPLPTIATDGAISLVEPLLIPYYRTGVAHGVEEPLQTATANARFGLAQAMVVPYGPRTEARPVDEPLPTVLTKDRLGVAAPAAEPFILSRNGNDMQRSVDDPSPTATGRGAGYLVEPFIVPQFGERDGQDPRVHDVAEPLPAATSHGAGGLVQPVVIQIAPRHGDIAGVRSADEPLYTIVTNPRLSVVNPCLVEVNHGDDTRSGDRSRSVEEPLSTVTTHRSVALIEPVLKAIRNGQLDPRRLVIIDGLLYQLDIRFRMLTNRELARAMSFEDNETTYEFVGTVSEVTKQIGNAVPVRTAAALVTAILGSPTIVEQPEAAS